jgi:Bacterial protein of unknown function (Gcw_chp)
MKRAFVLGGLVAALASAVPASAQVTIGWDAAAFSSYVWRGLSLTNKPVLQPDLYLTIPVGGASLTAGGWSSIDIGKYDGANDISEGGGTSAFNLTEFDWWAELAIPAGPVTITPGATGYIYPNDAGITKSSNTVEIYAKLSAAGPFSPKLSAYYDVDKVKGIYVEGGISHGFPLGPNSLTLGALAGWSHDMQPSSDPSANFADNGLTHVDLSASLPLTLGSLSLTPSVHGVINVDEWTKYTKANSKSDFKIWGGFTLSWSKEVGGKAKE